MDKKITEKRSPSVWSPYVNQVLDAEEQAIEDGLAEGLYVETPGQDAKMQEWKEAVENYKKKKSVTVRIYEQTLEKLRAKALEEGLPYQTLLSSILHKYVNGRLVERD
ncbi:MAG: hypothetical protein LCH46_10360 [Proteobacteria bacterium]|nr:hypothetical protein [Pseudomonadota bacterium]